jgi:hypothetical protein
MGFAAAFPESGISSNGNVNMGHAPRPLARSVRDIELALNANWREISSHAHRSDWQNHQELENKTGVDVAVLTL